MPPLYVTLTYVRSDLPRIARQARYDARAARIRAPAQVSHVVEIDGELYWVIDRR